MKWIAGNKSLLKSLGRGVILFGLLFLPSRPTFGAIDEVVGHYVGSWSNITFTSTGSAAIDI